MSAPADLTPDLDHNLPSLDAGGDPHPAAGALSGGNGDDAGSSSGSGGSGAKPSVAGDAGGVDAAPPPPSQPKPAAGEVLISEVMYATFTPEPASEWIEVYSKATSIRALSGLTIKDGGGRTHVIAPGVTIGPGEYLVLARSKAGAIAAKVPSSAIVYEYGAGLPDNAGVLLANGATGGVFLLNGPVAIASAPYGGWFSQSGGSSAQLHVLDGATSTSKTSWCLSLNAWTTGSEKGTPGSAADCL